MKRFDTTIERFMIGVMLATFLVVAIRDPEGIFLGLMPHMAMFLVIAWAVLR